MPIFMADFGPLAADCKTHARLMTRSNDQATDRQRRAEGGAATHTQDWFVLFDHRGTRLGTFSGGEPSLGNPVHVNCRAKQAMLHTSLIGSGLCMV